MPPRSTAVVVFLILAAAVSLTGFPQAIPATPGRSGYHVLRTIPVGGTEGWDYVSVVDNVPTQSGARTMAVDAKTHNILLVTAKRGHGARASAVVPNTFVVLVVGK